MPGMFYALYYLFLPNPLGPTACFSKCGSQMQMSGHGYRNAESQAPRHTFAHFNKTLSGARRHKES